MDGKSVKDGGPWETTLYIRILSIYAERCQQEQENKDYFFHGILCYGLAFAGNFHCIVSYLLWHQHQWRQGRSVDVQRRVLYFRFGEGIP